MDCTKPSFICDSCGKELLTETELMHCWGLVLQNKDYGINQRGEYSTRPTFPPLNHSKHFCNLTCLARWADENA